MQTDGTGSLSLIEISNDGLSLKLLTRRWSRFRTNVTPIRKSPRSDFISRAFLFEVTALCATSSSAFPGEWSVKCCIQSARPQRPPTIYQQSLLPGVARRLQVHRLRLKTHTWKARIRSTVAFRCLSAFTIRYAEEERFSLATMDTSA